MFTAILLKYENLINGYVLDLFIAYSSSCGVIRIRLRQFNLHKTNAANEELVISFFYRHEVQERKPTYLLLYHYTAQATRWEFSYWLQEILTINIL